MRLRLVFVFAFFGFALVWGQRKEKYSADDYFVAYNYARAAELYEDLQRNGSITSEQELNLALSYLKTKNYQKAADTYISVYQKDTLSPRRINGFDFNFMMQSISKSSYKDDFGMYLQDFGPALPNEMLENADFNLQLLNSASSSDVIYEIFNPGINSIQNDFSPAFYQNKLLFSSSRPSSGKSVTGSGEGYLDIYAGDLNAEGVASFPKRFKEIPKSSFHKATPSYAKALNSFLYILSNTKGSELAFDTDGKNALAIGQKAVDGRFNFLLKDLSTSFYYPFYDDISGRLYFAAEFADEGYGGTDIYYVYTNNGQIMSAPINLGPRINSPGNEIAPFIFEESLFFASDVFYGRGGMDIYRANIEDVNNFSIPVNLGDQINTPYDDFALVIRNHNEGLLGYFASNRKESQGGDDIYGFRVDKKPGLKTLALKGQVLKPYGNREGIPNALIELYDPEGNLIKLVYADNDGNYRIEVPWVSSITLKASKERYSYFSQFFNEEALNTLQNQNLDVGLSLYDDLVDEKEDQMVINMEPLNFGKGKTLITSDVEVKLREVIDFVQKFPAAQLRIECYTDSRGGSSTNFRFTQQRADAIKSYLIQQGVPAANLPYAVGFGEQKITNNCKNGVFCLEILHKQNQRTLFVVLNDNLLFD